MFLEFSLLVWLIEYATDEPAPVVRNWLSAVSIRLEDALRVRPPDCDNWAAPGDRLSRIAANCVPADPEQQCPLQPVEAACFQQVVGEQAARPVSLFDRMLQWWNGSDASESRQCELKAPAVAECADNQLFLVWAATGVFVDARDLFKVSFDGVLRPFWLSWQLLPFRSWSPLLFAVAMHDDMWCAPLAKVSVAMAELSFCSRVAEQARQSAVWTAVRFAASAARCLLVSALFSLLLRLMFANLVLFVLMWWSLRAASRFVARLVARALVRAAVFVGEKVRACRTWFAVRRARREFQRACVLLLQAGMPPYVCASILEHVAPELDAGARLRHVLRVHKTLRQIADARLRALIEQPD